jgi:hypothetical protein
MSNHDEEPKFLHGQTVSTVFTEDGIEVYDSVSAHNMSEEEVRGAMAQFHGVESDQVSINDEIDKVSRGVGRVSVGFTKWNSSWDPHAENADSNMN